LRAEPDHAALRALAGRTLLPQIEGVMAHGYDPCVSANKGFSPPRDARRSHRRAAGGRYSVSYVAEWVGPVCAGLLACWLFFAVRPAVVDDLQQRWGDHPRLLMLIGWAPMGLVFTAGCLIALRSDWLWKHERSMPKLELWAYVGLGSVVVPFAMMLGGYRGKYRSGDAQAVLDEVAATSQWIANGVAFGDAALTLFIACVIFFVITRIIRKIPRPGWSIQLTVASWCAIAALGSLACLLMWSYSVPLGA
jgi:hypothetical protein